MRDDTTKAAHARVPDTSWKTIHDTCRASAGYAQRGSGGKFGACAADDELGSFSPRGSIIFSLRDERVWASWSEATCQVDMGPVDYVEEMMRDFLAQTVLAMRLLAAARSAS